MIFLFVLIGYHDNLGFGVLIDDSLSKVTLIL